MKLRQQWTGNMIMIFFSWASLILIGRKSLQRYLPASILVIFIEALSTLYGKNRKWWVFYNKPNSYFSGEFSFNFGPFLALAVWGLKGFYGDFKKFLLFNGSVHAFFVTIIMYILKKLKVVRLSRINHLQLFFYFFYKAFLLYGMQMLWDKIKYR